MLLEVAHPGFEETRRALPAGPAIDLDDYAGVGEPLVTILEALERDSDVAVV